MEISKGLLSFLSGLGFMGLGFYIFFFTFLMIDSKFNYILLFSILTSVLGGIVVYFLATAFSFTETNLKINETASGFIGGILTMIAIIVMILSFRLEETGLAKNLGLTDKIHPVITFFLASACTLLLIWPTEEHDNRL